LVISLGDSELDDVEVRVREVGVGESVSETESRLDVVGEEMSVVCTGQSEDSARDRRARPVRLLTYVELLSVVCG